MVHVYTSICIVWLGFSMDGFEWVNNSVGNFLIVILIGEGGKWELIGCQ